MRGERYPQSNSIRRKLRQNSWTTASGHMGYIHTNWSTMNPILSANISSPSLSSSGKQAHHNSLSPAEKWAGWSLQTYHSLKTASLRFRIQEGLRYLRTATEVRFQYPNASHDRDLTVKYNFVKKAAIWSDTRSFGRSCFRFTERRPIVTYNSGTAGTRGAYEGSSRKTQGSETGNI